MEVGRWELGNPRFQILLEIFLRLEVGRDNNNWSLWGKFLQERGEERLRGRADSGARQHSAILQSPRNGLPGGSFNNVSEQAACR